MTTIVIYTDNTACVDGRFLNRKDTFSLLEEYRIPRDRPMGSSMTDNGAEHMERKGVHLIVFPTSNRISASVSIGLRRSEAFARRREATKKLHEQICSDYRSIRATGQADMFARYQLARKYGFAHGYLRVILKENGCLG